MRLAVISPTFPPDVCGVGDYTSNLTGELSKQGHEVAVWTYQRNPLSNSLMKTFNLSAFRGLSSILSWRPEAILIQYTPYLIAPRWYGVHPLFPFWVAGLRLCLRKPIFLVAHEMHYPVEFTRAGLLIGLPQFFQFAMLIHVCRSVIFTYKTASDLYGKLFPWLRSRFFWAPVGTNIRIQAQAVEMLPVAEDQRILFYFGRFHPTVLSSHLFRTLEEALKKFGEKNVLLVLAGVSESQLDLALKQASAEFIRPQIRALGFLTESQVSAWLQRADVVLTPFLDGACTRRTSIMAALAHSKPLVTTKAWSTNLLIPWNKICGIVDAKDEGAFVNCALDLLEDKAKAKNLAQEGFRYFEMNFAWSVIAQKIAQHIKALL